MIHQLKELVLGVAKKVSFIPPILARLIIGSVFVVSGWGKLHNLDKVISFFKELGIPAAQIQAPFVASVELVCGALVLVGLMTRLASLPLVGTMVVAILTAKLSELHGVTDLFGFQEFDYIVLLLWLFVSGPGWFSIDQLICKRCAGTCEKD